MDAHTIPNECKCFFVSAGCVNKYIFVYWLCILSQEWPSFPIDVRLANLTYTLYFMFLLSAWLFMALCLFISVQLYSLDQRKTPQTINLASWQPQHCGNEMWTSVVTKLTSFSVSLGIMPVGGEERGWGRNRRRYGWWGKATVDDELKIAVGGGRGEVRKGS